MESRSQMSVLLVDDEREVLLLFSMLLKRKFATCHVATNGEEALEILKSGAQIDCVITDISMPRMDGFELKINMDRLGYNIPVIGVTGHSEPEVIQRMKDLGFSHIMLKPVDKGELMKVIDASLQIVPSDNTSLSGALGEPISDGHPEGTHPGRRLS